MRTTQRVTAPPVTEKAFMAQVVDLTRLFGWDTYHPFLSVHSEHGWPDLAMVRPPRLIFAELKSEKGKVSVHQSRWLGLLEACPAVEVFLWRPSDFERIQAVLR